MLYWMVVYGAVGGRWVFRPDLSSAQFADRGLAHDRLDDFWNQPNPYASNGWYWSGVYERQYDGPWMLMPDPPFEMHSRINRPSGYLQYNYF